MALRDTVCDCYAIVTREARDGYQRLRLARVLGTFVLSTATLSRTRKVVTREWELLTYSAATEYMDCHATDCNTRYSAEEYDRVLKAWRLVAEVDSVGAWSLDTYSSP